MCPALQLEALTKEIVSSYRSVFGSDIDGIYLYGSYSRGEQSDQSDIDFVAIVHGDRLSLQKKLYSVWDRSSDIGSAYDVVISPSVIPYDEFMA